MKRCVLCLLILLSLSGCYKSNNNYLISSIGFDYEDGMYNTAFEAVISNSETDEQTVKLIKAKGDTIEKCVKEIEKQCTQEVLLSHCGIIAVGESVDKERLQEIYDYCFKNENITISVRFVKTENAEKLLSQEPVSAVAVGYDILNLTEQTDKSAKNRYFEIMAQNGKAKMPKVTLTKEGYYIEN